MLPFPAMRSLILGVIVIELLTGSRYDAGRTAAA
jgi:hypothetical protein